MFLPELIDDITRSERASYAGLATRLILLQWNVLILKMKLEKQADCRAICFSCQHQATTNQPTTADTLFVATSLSKTEVSHDRGCKAFKAIMLAQSLCESLEGTRSRRELPG